jgi:hypothetical protein
MLVATCGTNDADDLNAWPRGPALALALDPGAAALVESRFDPTSGLLTANAYALPFAKGADLAGGGAPVAVTAGGGACFLAISRLSASRADRILLAVTIASPGPNLGAAASVLLSAARRRQRVAAGTPATQTRSSSRHLADDPLGDQAQLRVLPLLADDEQTTDPVRHRRAESNPCVGTTIALGGNCVASRGFRVTYKRRRGPRPAACSRAHDRM